MSSKINIVTVVDVIGALSERRLENKFWMMDNSVFESQNQGTHSLCTYCQPGQLINWVIYGLDVQTPVAIKKISFLCGDEDQVETDELKNVEEPGIEINPYLNVWSGFVPSYLIPGTEYRYRLEVQMSKGVNSVMSIDTPSLKVPQNLLKSKDN